MQNSSHMPEHEEHMLKIIADLFKMPKNDFLLDSQQRTRYKRDITTMFHLMKPKSDYNQNDYQHSIEIFSIILGIIKVGLIRKRNYGICSLSTIGTR